MAPRLHPDRRALVAGAITAMEISEGSTVVSRLERLADVVLPADALDRLAGAWAPPGATFAFHTERKVTPWR